MEAPSVDWWYHLRGGCSFLVVIKHCQMRMKKKNYTHIMEALAFVFCVAVVELVLRLKRNLTSRHILFFLIFLLCFSENAIEKFSGSVPNSFNYELPGLFQSSLKKKKKRKRSNVKYVSNPGNSE